MARAGRQPAAGQIAQRLRQREQPTHVWLRRQCRWRVEGVRHARALQPTGAPRVTLQAGRSEDKSDAYQDGRFSSRFDSRRDSLAWQNDIDIAAGHTLTVGADYQRDEINGTTAYAEDSRDNFGRFVQYR